MNDIYQIECTSELKKIKKLKLQNTLKIRMQNEWKNF